MEISLVDFFDDIFYNINVIFLPSEKGFINYISVNNIRYNAGKLHNKI